jgi:hypothetical protein
VRQSLLEGDALEHGQALGVVGPQGEGQGHRDGRAVLHLDHDELLGAAGDTPHPGGEHGVGPVDGLAARDPHDRLDHRSGDHPLARATAGFRLILAIPLYGPAARPSPSQIVQICRRAEVCSTPPRAKTMLSISRVRPNR